MGTLLAIAARSLLQHRRRTVLLAGAIAAVTGLLTVLQGISAGMQETMITAATTLMTGHVNVAGFYKVNTGQAVPLVTQQARLLELVRRDVPELDYVVPRGRGWGKLVSDTGTLQVGFAGLDIEHEPRFRDTLTLVAGSFDGLRDTGTVLLFEEQAEKLGVGVGDVVTFSATTARGASNTADVRVVAIAGDIGLLSRFSAFTRNETLRQIYQLAPDTTGALQLYLKDMGAIEDVTRRLRASIAAAGFTVMDPDPQVYWIKFQAVNRESWTGQRIDVTDWETEVSFLTWTITALDTLTGFLVATLLLIIIVGIMNTMWIAIRERTKEIGTLRAIGMRRQRVLIMFLLEALILGAVGTGVGALGGAAVGLVVNAIAPTMPTVVQLFLMSETLRLSLHVAPIVGAAALIVVVTTFAAFFPARRAARLRPITAMHHVG